MPPKLQQPKVGVSVLSQGNLRAPGSSREVYLTIGEMVQGGRRDGGIANPQGDQ